MLFLLTKNPPDKKPPKQQGEAGVVTPQKVYTQKAQRERDQEGEDGLPCCQAVSNGDHKRGQMNDFPFNLNACQHDPFSVIRSEFGVSCKEFFVRCSWVSSCLYTPNAERRTHIYGFSVSQSLREQGNGIDREEGFPREWGRRPLFSA